jgi:aconitate hydratase
LENLLRHEDGHVATAQDIEKFKDYPRLPPAAGAEIPFKPARVLLQDFTGVPAVVDLAAMRDAIQRLGGDPGRINPLIPADLVIDHSIQVDAFGSPNALKVNEQLEYERNRERYGLLRWAQRSFSNFTVVPPGRGICHQVNLEYLASVVASRTSGSEKLAFPDTLVGPIPIPPW